MNRLYFSTLSGIAILAMPVEAGNNVKEEARMRKLAFDYAACVVRSHHAKATEAILTASENQVIMKQFPQIIDGECLSAAGGDGIDMRFPHVTYRNALADALVNADFAGRGEESFANRLPLAQPAMMSGTQQAEALAKVKSARKREELQKEFGQQNALGWLSRFGECVVRNSPEASRYWLLTKPDIPEETSRIKALQPAFATCLGSGTMKFTRVMMRGAVAINYYRLAMSTVVPGAASKQ